MSEIDFNDIANMAMDAITEPVPLPPGTWRGIINSGKYSETKSDNPKAPMARAVFAIRVSEAVEVADALLEGFDLDDADPVYHDIPIFDRRGNWNTKKFLQGLGVEWESDDTIQTACPKCKGYVVTFTTSQRRNPNAKNGGAPILVDVTDIAAG